MSDLIKNKERDTIETCTACGAEYYYVMNRCTICGNTILTSEKYSRLLWEQKRRVILRAAVALKLEQNKTQAA